MFIEKNVCYTIFLIVFVFDVVTGIPHNNSTRTKRQNCGFKCRSGECINEDLECDGKADCKDGSDETAACKRLKCPAYLFQCKYGACINKELECNGKADCRDASDENSKNCGKTNSGDRCRNDEFQCTSGQCISEDGKCDGAIDCSDGSDETANVCRNVKCPGFSFRCDYGACIAGNQRCDGRKDCVDNSDEDPNRCDYVTPISTSTSTQRPPVTPTLTLEGSCILPEHPVRGKWTIYGGTVRQPGQPVNDGTILTVSCNQNYAHQGESPNIVCIKGNWDKQIGFCERLCPPFKDTETTTVLCTRDQFLVNCSQPKENTIATFSCKPFHELIGSRDQLICKDGTWDYSQLICEPKCGLKTGKAEPLVVGGNITKKGDYPWHVALYNDTGTRQKYICGGSIISQNTVITAAHCVTSPVTFTLLPKELFSIGAGKYYSEYNDPRDKNAQYSTLEHIYLPEQYKGDELNYQADIAILILKERLIITQIVQPVCFDRRGYEEIILNKPDLKGFVPGWGFTSEGGEISSPLKDIFLPYIHHSQCQMDLPPDFQVFLTYDKICSGFLSQGESVCNGDSGGGLVFRYPATGRYYLTGIVSVSPPSKTAHNSCDSQQYTLFTRVSKYLQFILRYASI